MSAFRPSPIDFRDMQAMNEKLERFRLETVSRLGEILANPPEKWTQEDIAKARRARGFLVVIGELYKK